MRFPWSRQPEATVETAPRKPRRVVGVNLDSGTLYGVRSYDWRDLEGMRTAGIPRDVALSVPAYLRAHEIIATEAGQLPLQLLDATNTPRPDWLWLTSEPTPGEPASVTYTQILGDLVDYRAAWLLQEPGTYGRGPRYRRLDPASVTVVPDVVTTAYGTYETWPETPGLIRIDSPTQPLLIYGARALMTLARLEEAARLMADGTPPIDWFETTDDVGLDDLPGSAEDPDDPELSELEAFLEKWREARRKRTTAYIPPGLVYKTSGFNPEQLQLGKTREEAILEIARLTGVDAEDLSVSTTTRTYFNAHDRRRRKTRDLHGPYLRAVESRLSMADVTPRGYRVAFDLVDAIKPDDLEAAQIDKLLVDAGLMTRDEIRARRGLEPLPAGADQAEHSDVVDAEIVETNEPAGLGQRAPVPGLITQRIKEISR